MGIRFPKASVNIPRIGSLSALLPRVSSRGFGMTDFKDTKEAMFRRNVRDTVKRSNLTRTQKDVTLALLNHWFVHRGQSEGTIHPGREKLAKKAKASIATVKRTLEILRRFRAIEAVAHLHGLHGNATEYKISIPHLTLMCEQPKEVINPIGGSNEPTHGRAKMTHRSCDVIAFPSQRVKRHA